MLVANQDIRQRTAQELGKGALSQHAVLENHISVIPIINQAFSEVAWQIEIVSATYVTLDVTNCIRQFVSAHHSNPQAFIPSNTFFGGVDPIPNSVKAFVLV